LVSDIKITYYAEIEGKKNKNKKTENKTQKKTSQQLALTRLHICFPGTLNRIICDLFYITGA